MSNLISNAAAFMIGDGYAWSCPHCGATTRVRARDPEGRRRMLNHVRDSHTCPRVLPQ